MGADQVPETSDLEGAEAWETLRRVRYVPLLRESVERIREADGFSYARALGFQIVLATFPALIFFVALAVWSGNASLQRSVDAVVTSLTPGPTSGFLQDAVERGEQGAQGNTLAMLLGGVTALTSGVVGMSQLQLGAGRLYGKDEDRPFFRRYGLSLLLALTVGVMLAGALVAIAFGGGIAEAIEGQSPWAWLRWPIAVVVASVAIAVLYHLAPNREQPSVSWLIVGGTTATMLWLAFSGGLAAYLSLSSNFSDIYGPLAGLVGFLIWAQLTAMALFAGIAVSAELEYQRTRRDALATGD